MKILSLDPSSTCCGYAVMTSADRAEEFGILTPEKAAASYEIRAMSLARQIHAAALEVTPEAVVIEIPSRHVNHRRNGGNGAGIAQYAFAAGFAAGKLDGHVDLRMFRADEWTGEVPKPDRIAALRVWCRQYNREAAKGFDTGGDAGDALSLGRWWFKNKVVSNVAL